MIENDNKGSFGCFSVAGRQSIEKYKVLAFRDQILGGKESGVTKQNTDDQREDAIDDYLDLFVLNSNEKKQEFQKKIIRKCQSAKPPNEMYKYYKKHRDQEKKKPTTLIGPTCTKYNPKKELTWNRSITGPLWRTQSARKFHIRQDDTHYYINHEDITAHTVGKSLIDMSKMTMRGEFSDIKDLRIKNIKPFNKSRSDKVLTSTKRNVESSNTSSKQNTYTNSIHRELVEKSKLIRKKFLNPNLISPTSRSKPTSGGIFRKVIKNNINTTTSSLQDSYDEYKHIYQKQFKKRPQSVSVGRKKNKKAEIKAPDFKKVITREHLNNLSDNKKSLIPFSMPNFKQVRERPIMMVVYDRIVHKKPKKETVKAIDPNINYNPDKYINRINNHSVASPPNFKLMYSRTINDDPLPLYMKKIFSRAAAYETTDLTLKMNNYAEGKFPTDFSSFFPKKTFNKIINLNLLNSKQLLKNCKWKKETGDRTISKSMKFYRKLNYIYIIISDKNYDELLKENMLSQFDGVTYKTNKKGTQLNPNDIENFLYEYEIKEEDYT